MKNRRCGNCGQFEMKVTKTQGPFKWKDFQQVTLVKPLDLLRCATCGEHGLRPGDSSQLDKAIEASIRTYAKEWIEMILAREECSQVELATRVGITPEYLSWVKNGARTPAFQTFNMLKTFASDPRAFLISDPFMEMIENIKEDVSEVYGQMISKLA